MGITTSLWRIELAKLTGFRRSTLDLEADLHAWIKGDPGLLNQDLMILGSETVTAFGGRIDILGVDSRGTIHVIELKRDRTPRDVIAQVLDYASWVASIGIENIHEIFANHSGQELGTAFRARFGVALPDSLGAEHSITIVASSLDPASERIVAYLSETFGVAINVVYFSVFEDAYGKVLTRTWLLDPDEVEGRTDAKAPERGTQREWTGFWFVNIGLVPTEDRSWEDARTYGFVSGGQGRRYRSFMQKLKVGDRIFGYVSGSGYVGYGEVTGDAVMARDFTTASGELLLDQPLVGATLRANVDDEELSEYVVAVDWQRSVEVADAFKFPGIFAKQHVVCKIYDARTVEFLLKEFEV